MYLNEVGGVGCEFAILIAMQWARKQTGFTIVELLIVVVVIAILAAITIVSYNGITERSRMSVAQSFAGQIQRGPEAIDTNALYKFDACSGSSIVDSSGKNANGTVAAGTANWSTDTPSGTGCSFQFNGSTYISVPVILQADYYMKAAWVKMTSCAGGNNIVSSPTGAANSHAWYAPSGGQCRMSAGNNGSWSTIGDSTTIADGKWHHVALEFKSTSSTVGNLTLFRDGTQVSQVTNVAKIATLDPVGSLIGSYTGGNLFTGLMDDVLIISR